MLQNNQLRWNRLENLLREGSKSSDFDASQLWLLANWLLSPNAEGIRHKLAVELARMLDATAASQARERIAVRWAASTGMLVSTAAERLLMNMSFCYALIACVGLCSGIVALNQQKPNHDCRCRRVQTSCLMLSCSFRNPELANRWVPVQPSEEDARERAALLVNTLRQRLAPDSSIAISGSSTGASVAVVQPSAAAASWPAQVSRAVCLSRYIGVRGVLVPVACVIHRRHSTLSALAPALD